MVKKSKRWETMDKGNTPLAKLTLQYEAFNRTEGKSENTVSWYNHVLWRLNDYLQENGYSTELKHLDLELIRTYILHLQKRQRYDRHPFIPQQEEGLSPVSIQNYVRALRAFFNWLYREGYTEEPVLERLKPPKCPKKLVEPLILLCHLGIEGVSCQRKGGCDGCACWTGFPGGTRGVPGVFPDTVSTIRRARGSGTLHHGPADSTAQQEL